MWQLDTNYDVLLCTAQSSEPDEQDSRVKLDFKFGMRKRRRVPQHHHPTVTKVRHSSSGGGAEGGDQDSVGLELPSPDCDDVMDHVPTTLPESSKQSHTGTMSSDQLLVFIICSPSL